jgi:hypothetical protein
MALKVDGTNSKIVFLAGTANYTNLTSSLSAIPWTMTLPPTAGAPGQVLTTDGNGVLTWTSGGGTAVNISNDTTTNANLFPLYANATTGTLSTAYVASPDYTYNPSKGQLSAPVIAATRGIFLNADTITANYTIPVGMNGLSAGPIIVSAGVTVTVPPSQSWKVV